MTKHSHKVACTPRDVPRVPQGETSWNFPEGAPPANITPEDGPGQQLGFASGDVIEPQQLDISEMPSASTGPVVGVGVMGAGRGIAEVFGDGLPKLLLLLIASFVLMVQVTQCVPHISNQKSFPLSHPHSPHPSHHPIHHPIP